MHPIGLVALGARTLYAKENVHAIHHRRRRKYGQHRSLLRRPRRRPADRPHTRVAAERRLVGEAIITPACGGVSRHHLRSQGIRQFQQADFRLQLQHVSPETCAKSSRNSIFATPRLWAFPWAAAKWRAISALTEARKSARPFSSPRFRRILLQTADNPEGAPGSLFEGIKQAIVADRPAFLTKFLHDFYNVDVLGGTRISDQAVQLSWNVGVGASPKGTLDCVSAWLEDFRGDLAKIDVPTLVIHGDSDRILPLPITGKRTHESVKGSSLVVVEGGPHGTTWTHADVVNPALLDFLAQKAPATRKPPPPAKRKQVLSIAT